MNTSEANMMEAAAMRRNPLDLIKGMLTWACLSLWTFSVLQSKFLVEACLQLCDSRFGEDC